MVVIQYSHVSSSLLSLREKFRCFRELAMTCLQSHVKGVISESKNFGEPFPVGSPTKKFYSTLFSTDILHFLY
jgi:hypothetical protein